MSLGCFHSQESYTSNPTFQSILKEAQKESEENKKAKNLINLDDVSLCDKFLSTLQTYLRSIPVEGLSEQEQSEISIQSPTTLSHILTAKIPYINYNLLIYNTSFKYSYNYI